jgi:glycosyltransferase involved in cell wall biosynthesis
MAIRRAVSAVMPACNEEACIVSATENLRSALAACTEEFEIILVDDGSRDATGRLMDGLAETYPEVRVIHHRPNAGYGVSLRDGFLAARLPLVFYTDSNNQFDMSEIRLLLAKIDQAEIVTGYRARRQDPWPRKFFSWGFRKLIGVSFGVYVRDCDCAFKLYRRKVFKHITMESRMFFIDPEILAKANALGYRIEEVAVTHLPRAGGRTTVRLSHILTTLREAWHLMRTFDLKPDPTTRRAALGETEAAREE